MVGREGDRDQVNNLQICVGGLRTIDSRRE
jgi:hypothetical protein